MILNMPALNRPVPSLAPDYFKTYEVSRPRSTHFRKASCVEVDCPNRARGWRTIVDVSTPLGRSQANYIRMRSSRTFTFTEAGTIVTFTFPPGQHCFSDHRVPLDREPHFLKLAGDWRSYGRRQELRVADWLGDFGEHQAKLAEQRRRG